MKEPDSASPWITKRCTKVDYKAMCPYCKLPLDIYVVFQVRDVYRKGGWVKEEKRKRMLIRCEQFRYKRFELPPRDLFKAKRYYKDGDIPELESCCTLIHSCGKVSLLSVLDMMGQSLLMHMLVFSPVILFREEILKICEGLKNEVDIPSENI